MVERPTDPASSGPTLSFSAGRHRHPVMCARIHHDAFSLLGYAEEVTVRRCLGMIDALSAGCRPTRFLFRRKLYRTVASARELS